MKGRLIITAATAVLVAAGLGSVLALGGGANAATTRATTRAAVVAAKSPDYVVLDCSFKPEVKPSTYVWTCADYGMGVQDMRWASWTPRLASGYGIFWENDCTPNCAAGKILRYPVLVKFWGTAAAKGHPADRRYTELTLMFPGKRPPVYGPNAAVSHPLTQTFPTDYDHS